MSWDRDQLLGALAWVWERWLGFARGDGGAVLRWAGFAVLALAVLGAVGPNALMVFHLFGR